MEIKFRAKGLDKKEWVYGYAAFDSTKENAVIIHKQGNNEMQHTGVDPKTVSQYTGLKDKNGKEIYEDDILYGREEGDGETTAWTNVYYIVFFKNGAFHVKEKHMKDDSCWCDYLGDENILNYYEVVGNIYENKKLLKK